ncbi:MAG: hypothetical protein A4E49_01457 [Methanosaeta sp. PtaU1.Bin112]|nr:MAG: hypothetical protein A4E49_01457 [Methanosaeta sp. PtaU1.Bin112]
MNEGLNYKKYLLALILINISPVRIYVDTFRPICINLSLDNLHCRKDFDGD